MKLRGPLHEIEKDLDAGPAVWAEHLAALIIQGLAQEWL